MAILGRQTFETPSKSFTLRVPKEVYDTLADLALKKRVTLTTAARYLMEEALSAESGKPYKPFTATQE